MCFENTEIGQFFLLFKNYWNNRQRTYEECKKDDNHNTIIDMQPLNNSREIATQTDGIIGQQAEWEVICDNN